jgi:toxin ParE1/3/4
MKVRYSRRATSDLASIREFLSDRSPAGTTNVLVGIYAAIEFIRRNPRGAERTNLPGVRGKAVRKYRFKIFYRVIENDAVVEIIHIRHSSRQSWEGE